MQGVTTSISDSNLQNQSLSDKFSYIPTLMKFMIPLGLVYFFEYLINQGLVSTKIIREKDVHPKLIILIFSSSWFTLRKYGCHMQSNTDGIKYYIN